MYLNVYVCIYMYPVCICTYMHVFVRICMYAISTENMPSIIVYMTWASGVYVFECMCSCYFSRISWTDWPTSSLFRTMQIVLQPITLLIFFQMLSWPSTSGSTGMIYTNTYIYLRIHAHTCIYVQIHAYTYIVCNAQVSRM